MSVDNKMLGIDLSKRKFGLDILRALAIIYVLLLHTPFDLSPVLTKILNFCIFDGVAIFFVLSGYLIGTILIKTIDEKGFNTKNLFHFWVNRWFRTIPPYYFVLILLFVLSKSFDLRIQSYFLSVKDKLSYFFFLQNFKSPHTGFFPESWSLTIEEWFYLLIPIILFILYRLSKISIKKSLILTIVIVTLGVISYRLYSYYFIFSENIDLHIYAWNFYGLVVTRLDAIMFGVLGAFVHYFYESKWSSLKKTSFILGIVILIIDHLIHFLLKYDVFTFQSWVGVYACCYSFSIFSIGVLLLLPYMTNIEVQKRGKTYKVITFISLISYSLYLLHSSFIAGCIMEPLSKVLVMNNLTFIFIYWTLSIVLSTIMFLYIEKPSMNIRKKIFDKK